MAVYQSQEGYVGFARQTGSGAGAYQTPTLFMYANSVDMEPEDNLLIPDAEIGTGRDMDDDVYVGPVKWTGSMDFMLRPEAVGYLILGATGAVTSSGISGSAKGHKFTFENDLVPLSVERKVGDGLEVLGYNDTKVNMFRIEAAAGELASGSADLISVQETSGKSEQTDTYETAPIFTFAGGSVTLEDSVIQVKNVSFEVNNNIVDDDYRLGSRTLGSLTEGRRELSASVDIVPENSDTYKKAVYGSADATTVSGGQQTHSGSLHLHFESADGVYINGTTQKYTLDVNVPKAVFRSAPLPTSGDDLVVETLELLPVKGTSDIAEITVRNSVANYDS